MEIITRKEAKAQGLKRYFTGKPCKRGHVAERWSADAKCSECKKEYKRKHYVENRDKILEQKRQYYDENRDECLERGRKWYTENIDRVREYNRQYRADNRDQCLEQSRQYYAENRDQQLERKRQHYIENRDWYREYNRQYYVENRDKALEYIREWREENPEYERQYREANREKIIAIDAKRRAAKLDRTLSHEEELTQFVMQEAAKHASDMEEVFGTPFHVDHMIPMQGKKVSGLHVWYNLQVIPAHLNISKGNRMRYTQPLKWMSDAT